MKSIYLPDTGRVLVADAKRMMRDAAPREMFIDVYEEMDEHGNLVPDGKVQMMPVESSTFGPWLDDDFPEACKRLGIAPRWRWRPVLQDYSGGIMHDSSYTIDHDEFVWLAALFDLSVVVGEPADTAAPVSADDAPRTKRQGQELPDWKSRIQIEAGERMRQLRKAGANPTVHSILGLMAAWCRDNDVRTTSGIHPSSGYLRTHVLGGGHWTPPV